MDDDHWLKPLLEKRSPDALHVLLDLVQAGLRDGTVSANNVQERRYACVNVIGGCFKILPRLGFIHTDERVKSHGPQKHHRRVDVWQLANRWKAEAFLREAQRTLLALTPPDPQAVLKM